MEKQNKKVIISEEVIGDVEDLTEIDKEKIEETEVSIIFDTKQYTLKIPKKIADKVSIDQNKDKFIFQVKTYPIEEQKKPDLIIIFKRG